MTACLGAVAARFHRAPAPTVIFGLVDEQVAAAAVILTFTHSGGSIGSEQLSRSPGDRPKDEITIQQCGWQLPVKRFILRFQLQM